MGAARRIKRGPGETSVLSSGGRAVCVPGLDSVGEPVMSYLSPFQALRLMLQPVQPVALTPFSGTRSGTTF